MMLYDRTPIAGEFIRVKIPEKDVHAAGPLYEKINHKIVQIEKIDGVSPEYIIIYLAGINSKVFLKRNEIYMPGDDIQLGIF